MRALARALRIVVPALALPLLAWRPSVWAGPLVPSKPSQVVTLAATGTTCVVGRLFEVQHSADGISVPFSIPPGQVLVVTGFDWSVTGTSGSTVSAFLTIDTGTAFQEAFSDGALADSSGLATKSVLVPNLIVKSGPRLCAGAGGGALVGALVHGFLAKDK